MKNLTAQFLQSHLPQATDRFRALIDEMREKDVTKVLLTLHPGYGMHLGIAGTDRGFDILETEMDLVQDYNKACEQFEREHGCGDDEEWFDYCFAFDWVRDAWLAAEGASSGLHVVLLDNGMGDEVDLTTGEEPAPELGFEDIG